MGERSSWTLIANSEAGSVERRTLGRVLEVLAEDAPTVLRWTGRPDDVLEAAERDPDSTLVLLGGDGTFSDSLDVLIEAGVDRPVGLLPGGTGNDFARGHGIPLDPTEAVRAMVTARPRPVHALRVNDRHAINAVHVGIGADASRRATGLKKYLRAAAYPVAALGEGLTHTAHDICVESDGEEIASGQLLMAAVALGRTIGGGSALADEGADGQPSADLMLAGGSGPWARAGLARAVLGPPPKGSSTIDVRQVRHVRFTAADPFPVNLDGNDLGDVAELTLEVLPNAWSALLPTRTDS